MELKKFRICERMDAHLHMATRNQGSQLARKHLGVATRNDNVGIVLCVPIAETFLKMLNLLNFVDENIIVFIPNKTLFNPRIEVILGIRPKLRLMNQKLRRLTRAIKYTSLADVWTEIDYNAREGADKMSVTRKCMERWKRNGRR